MFGVPKAHHQTVSIECNEIFFWFEIETHFSEMTTEARICNLKISFIFFKKNEILDKLWCVVFVFRLPKMKMLCWWGGGECDNGNDMEK